MSSNEFDYKDKQYMNKPESVRENETHEIIWDFEISTDHPIQTRKPRLVLINMKRSYHQRNFVVPADQWVKTKECEKIDKWVDLTR